MAKPIRVGLIGANATRGWAREGHVPALKALDGLKLVAVATHSQETADASAQAFGVFLAYGCGLDLIQSPEIDLVTIATQVPDHRELVLAALAAGKNVYSEWPLGRDIVEAEEMAAAAQAAGVHTAIGLQLRGNPYVQRTRDVIVSGAIGRVLSIRAYSATAAFGPKVPAQFLYLENPKNFANLVTIQGAHTLDLAIAVAGPLIDLSALATAQYPMIEVGDEHEPRARVTFDHLLLQGRLAQGSVLSVEVAGGRPPETPFHMEIVGETGSLRLVGGAARGFQSGRLTLSLNGALQEVNEDELAAIPDAAANVAGVYAYLRDDIDKGTFASAGFDHAVKLTRLMTEVLESSRGGSRVTASNWPEPLGEQAIQRYGKLSIE